MSPEDLMGDAVERLEWDERKEEETPPKKWRQMTRRTALTGAAAGVAAAILEACGSSSSSTSATGTGTSKAATGGGSSASAIFGVSGGYKFTFVNHVTTNPFFTPTQNGAADACKLLGCSYQWTGSDNSVVGQMVSAFNSAVSAGVDGIAISLVSLTAFNPPVQKALSAGIPVVAYNADAAGNARLAYIGQDLFVSGQEMGKRIAELVPSGDIALFIATPGSLNIQPRIDGAQNTLKSHSSITPHVVATGAALTQELSTIQSYITAHQNYKGFFAVDGGSTQSIGQVLQKQGPGKFKGGGYDLTPVTQQTLASGALQFTIDQQPYLQGFLPILQLYMYKASQSLTGIADVNTGLKFLDKTSVAPYNSTKSRYEGTSSAAGVQKA
ncbi:MAG: sugar ABC transporter substrate-binding protein [Solirubrobacterales bacterium]|nr:sugar ABC transporter substrate-binding protein [Solirubrobacterales bacterium]MBV9944895.1 sugar ABC transporter substrate-binding protein [Solirubrobacterales bacterium]